MMQSHIAFTALALSHLDWTQSTRTFKPSYASSKVKNENDAIRNRISDFDKRRISQQKTQ